MSISSSPDFSLPASIPNSVCFLGYRVKEPDCWPRALLALQEADVIYQCPQKDSLHQLPL